MPQTCEKPFFKNIGVVLRKKSAWNNSKYSRSGKILKIGRLAKAIVFAKMVSLGQKLKMPKLSENPFCKNIRVVLRKKPFEITVNIREMRRVSQSDILQRL